MFPDKRFCDSTTFYQKEMQKTNQKWANLLSGQVKIILSAVVFIRNI